jgi:hypothetical protein
MSCFRSPRVKMALLLAATAILFAVTALGWSSDGGERQPAAQPNNDNGQPAAQPNNGNWQAVAHRKRHKPKKQKPQNPAQDLPGAAPIAPAPPPPDTTPPVATITDGPKEGATVQAQSVTFRFSANEPSTFECRLKRPSVSNPAFTSCESPQKYRVRTGPPTFELRATDTAGNISDVVSRNFTVLQGQYHEGKGSSVAGRGIRPSSPLG